MSLQFLVIPSPRFVMRQRKYTLSDMVYLGPPDFEQPVLASPALMGTCRSAGYRLKVEDTNEPKVKGEEADDFLGRARHERN
jgi:hypothetical protein